MENEYKDYVIVMWNNDSKYKGQTQNIETQGEAESLFSEYFNQFENIELVEINTTRTVLKHKYMTITS